MSTFIFERTSAPEGRAYALPLTYSHSFLTLLPRDPRCVFAQWDVTDKTLPSAPTDDAGGLVLRMYDINVSAIAAGNGEAPAPPDRIFPSDVHPFVDFPVSARHSMYIRLTESGRTVTAEIGVLDGGFTPLLTSNVVTTPPGRPADDDESWRGGVFSLGPMFHVGPAGAHWHGETSGQAGSSDFAWRRT